MQALEAAAVGGGDRPVDQSDARAIQSAVVRATGHAPIAGGLAATAQSAADLNTRCPTADKTTLADLLMVSIISSCLSNSTLSVKSTVCMFNNFLFCNNLEQILLTIFTIE